MGGELIKASLNFGQCNGRFIDIRDGELEETGSLGDLFGGTKQTLMSFVQRVEGAWE